MQEETEKSSNSSSSSSRRKKMKMWLLRRMKVKESWRWRWRFLGSAFKWKRVNLQLSFLDNLLFKIMSLLEAIVLVATLCFFFLCCGCHF
ncbi:uncharacterized protein LOC8264139 [Ricinus communis]|uniref:uncharacterized protein LOC8264139 n=1 Tax=Ricinus communis TaxID=3988 RepID=UPI000772907E|nr:uncharacterized protein LOC8264139 [Ricinus communis]|eukprot:XP_015574970.1 uncharacterized protein LOC8264139 [Ricinus communis]